MIAHLNKLLGGEAINRILTCLNVQELGLHVSMKWNIMNL